MGKLSKFWPDTPEEISKIGSAINRLGTVITGIGAVQKQFVWVLISAGLTWLGFEIVEYFKVKTYNPGDSGEPEQKG